MNKAFFANFEYNSIKKKIAVYENISFLEVIKVLKAAYKISNAIIYLYDKNNIIYDLSLFKTRPKYLAEKFKSEIFFIKIK